MAFQLFDNAEDLVRDGFTILDRRDFPGEVCLVCRLPYGEEVTGSTKFEAYHLSEQMPFPDRSERFSNDPVRLPCGHILGMSCARDWLSGGNRDCMVCRQILVRRSLNAQGHDPKCQCIRCFCQQMLDTMSVRRVIKCRIPRVKEKAALDAAEVQGKLASIMRLILVRLYSQEPMPDQERLHYLRSVEKLHREVFTVTPGPYSPNLGLTDPNIQEMAYAQAMPRFFNLFTAHLERMDGRFFTPVTLRDELLMKIGRELTYDKDADNRKLREAIRMSAKYFVVWWFLSRPLTKPRWSKEGPMSMRARELMSWGFQWTGIYILTLVALHFYGFLGRLTAQDQPSLWQVFVDLFWDSADDEYHTDRRDPDFFSRPAWRIAALLLLITKWQILWAEET